MPKREMELKLLETYAEEMEEIARAGAKISSEEFDAYRNRFHTKLRIYEKQIYNYKQQFPDDEEIRPYEAMLYIWKSQEKMREAVYFDQNLKCYKVLDLVDKALEIRENPKHRFIKVLAYRELNLRQDALLELDYLLENYADDEEIYLEARKFKDEIEASPKPGCFIATAAYEPAEMVKVDILRAYRDQVLLESNLGKHFVSFYYATSPSFARIIAKSHLLKSVVRTLLNPIVKAVSISARKRR